MSGKSHKEPYNKLLHENIQNTTFSIWINMYDTYEIVSSGLIILLLLVYPISYAHPWKQMYYCMN